MKKKTTEMIPAVIYARYSSSNQREESIEGQIRVCTAYAKNNNLTVLRTYTDSALTGRTDRRPSFQQMIADSKKGQFRAVIVWKLDRFARNRYDSAIYRAKLKQNGVQIYSAMEAISDGPEGILMESVMEGLAEYYSANLAENVRRGMYENALHRKSLGGHTPLGLVRGSEGYWEIDPATAPTVRRIFAEYASGKPSQAICDDLNAEGIRTSSGKPFSLDSIRRIISNEKYMGVYEYMEIRDEHAIPPIVDQETFRKCQEIKKSKQHGYRKATAPEPFLLTTKLFCAECGSPMLGDSGTSKTGVRHYYYTCKNHRSGQCPVKSVRKELVETKICDQLIRLIHDDDFISAVADAVMIYQDESDISREIQAKEKALSDAERARDNLVKSLEYGVDLNLIAGRLNELADQIEQLRVSLGKTLIENPILERDQIVFLLERLRQHPDQSSDEYRRTLVQAFLSRAEYHADGSITLWMTYRSAEERSFSEGTKKADNDSSDCRRQPGLELFYPNPDGFRLLMRA